MRERERERVSECRLKGDRVSLRIIYPFPLRTQRFDCISLPCVGPNLLDTGSNTRKNNLKGTQCEVTREPGLIYWLRYLSRSSATPSLD